MRVVRNMRPLCFHEGILYCSRFADIFATADYGESFTRVGSLDLRSPAKALVSSFPLLQRLLRASIYRMRVLPNGNMIFIFKGGIYTLKAGETTAQRTFPIERGVRPVSLAASTGGFVVFGEYWSNADRQEVKIYGSCDFGESWQPIYTFGPKSIRHVHGISYDRWDDCFWICTGDYGDECRLLRASRDFQQVDVVSSHGQLNRFYSMYVGPSYLLMGTDTPLEQNYVMEFDKRSCQIVRRQPLENSSFYHCEVNGLVFVSTTAEPSPVNDVNFSHIWAGRPQEEPWTRVLSFAVDFWTRCARFPGIRKGLSQIPRVFFPEGPNPSTILACHCTGLRDYDNAMLCFDTSPWDQPA
jgi:hypothetical protein